MDEKNIERPGTTPPASGDQAPVTDWQPIETAPKTQPGEAAEAVILGFAADEEGYSPNSREGYWQPLWGRWVSTLDPTWRDGPQPTHWMPLPSPPTGRDRPFRYQYLVKGRGPFPHPILRDVSGDFRTSVDEQLAGERGPRIIGLRAVHADEYRWEAAGWAVMRVEELAGAHLPSVAAPASQPSREA